MCGVYHRRQSVYIIEDLVRGKQIKTHVHNLSPFLFKPSQVDPQDVAQQNEQEFVVAEIVAHRGDHQRRSNMEFLVRWTGYDETSNSWEPYTGKVGDKKRQKTTKRLYSGVLVNFDKN